MHNFIYSNLPVSLKELRSNPLPTKVENAMKKSLASIEIRQIVKELQSLKGSKLDTIYHPKEGEVYLLFHITGEGKKILKIISGKFLYITSSRPIAGEPSGFCLLLRKHLDNARVREIRQLESERIVAITFEKEEQKKLYIELFGRGNIIMCDKDDCIIGALSYPSFKDREIKAKKAYNYPKMKINLFSMSEKDFTSLLKASSLALVKCLAIEVGMGGPYAEEVCIKSGIDKGRPSDELVEDENAKLFSSIQWLLMQAPSPGIWYGDQSATDATPVDLALFPHAKDRNFLSYNEALDYYFTNEYKEEKPISQGEKEIAKLKNIIDAQERHLSQLELEEQEERENADSIFVHYSTIKDIVGQVKTAAEEHGWANVGRNLKSLNALKKVNPRFKTIEIEL
ncbi:NFACT family protein [Candidatus Woesearchaeota archaeon]|nr:NFACT family protein [Candidatus Woesearchaeota archaeon]